MSLLSKIANDTAAQAEAELRRKTVTVNIGGGTTIELPDARDGESPVISSGNDAEYVRFEGSTDTFSCFNVAGIFDPSLKDAPFCAAGTTAIDFAAIDPRRDSPIAGLNGDRQLPAVSLMLSGNVGHDRLPADLERAYTDYHLLHRISSGRHQLTPSEELYLRMHAAAIKREKRNRYREGLAAYTSWNLLDISSPLDRMIAGGTITITRKTLGRSDMTGIETDPPVIGAFTSLFEGMDAGALRGAITYTNNEMAGLLFGDQNLDGVLKLEMEHARRRLSAALRIEAEGSFYNHDRDIAHLETIHDPKTLTDEIGQIRAHIAHGKKLAVLSEAAEKAGGSAVIGGRRVDLRARVALLSELRDEAKFKAGVKDYFKELSHVSLAQALDNIVSMASAYKEKIPHIKATNDTDMSCAYQGADGPGSVVSCITQSRANAELSKKPEYMRYFNGIIGNARRARALLDRGKTAAAQRLFAQFFNEETFTAKARELDGDLQATQAVTFMTKIYIISLAAAVAMPAGAAAKAMVAKSTGSAFLATLYGIGAESAAFLAVEKPLSMATLGENPFPHATVGRNAAHLYKEWFTMALMFGFMKGGMGAFNKISRSVILRSATKRLIEQGVITRAQAAQMTPAAKKLIMAQAELGVVGKILNGTGMYGAEFASFTVWDLMVQTYETSRRKKKLALPRDFFTGKSFGERLLFLMALKIGGQMTAPLTQALQSRAAAALMKRYQPQLKAYEAETSLLMKELAQYHKRGGCDFAKINKIYGKMRAALKKRLALEDALARMDPSLAANAGLTRARLAEVKKLKGELSFIGMIESGTYPKSRRRQLEKFLAARQQENLLTYTVEYNGTIHIRLGDNGTRTVAPVDVKSGTLKLFNAMWKFFGKVKPAGIGGGYGLPGIELSPKGKKRAGKTTAAPPSTAKFTHEELAQRDRLVRGLDLDAQGKLSIRRHDPNLFEFELFRDQVQAYLNGTWKGKHPPAYSWRLPHDTRWTTADKSTGMKWRDAAAELKIQMTANERSRYLMKAKSFLESSDPAISAPRPPWQGNPDIIAHAMRVHRKQIHNYETLLARGIEAPYPKTPSLLRNHRAAKPYRNLLRALEIQIRNLRTKSIKPRDRTHEHRGTALKTDGTTVHGDGASGTIGKTSIVRSALKRFTLGTWAMLGYVVRTGIDVISRIDTGTFFSNPILPPIIGSKKPSPPDTNGASPKTPQPNARSSPSTRKIVLPGGTGKKDVPKQLPPKSNPPFQIPEPGYDPIYISRHEHVEFIWFNKWVQNDGCLIRNRNPEGSKIFVLVREPRGSVRVIEPDINGNHKQSGEVRPDAEIAMAKDGMRTEFFRVDITRKEHGAKIPGFTIPYEPFAKPVSARRTQTGMPRIFLPGAKKPKITPLDAGKPDLMTVGFEGIVTVDGIPAYVKVEGIGPKSALIRTSVERGEKTHTALRVVLGRAMGGRSIDLVQDRPDISIPNEWTGFTKNGTITFEGKTVRFELNTPLSIRDRKFILDGTATIYGDFTNKKAVQDALETLYSRSVSELAQGRLDNVHIRNMSIKYDSSNIGKLDVTADNRRFPLGSVADTIFNGKFKNESDTPFIRSEEIKSIGMSPDRFKNSHADSSGIMHYGLTDAGKSVVQQAGMRGCTAACEAMLLLDHGKRPNVGDFKTRNLGNERLTLHILKAEGLKADVARIETSGTQKELGRQLERLVAEHGSGILSVAGEIGGHVIVLDAISLSNNTATIRDPYHGWSITVTADAVISRHPSYFIFIRQ